MTELWIGVDDHNFNILNRVRSSGIPKLDAASWKKTKAKFESGSLAGPFFSFKNVERLLLP